MEVRDKGNSRRRLSVNVRQESFISSGDWTAHLLFSIGNEYAWEMERFSRFGDMLNFLFCVFSSMGHANDDAMTCIYNVLHEWLPDEVDSERINQMILDKYDEVEESVESEFKVDQYKNRWKNIL